MGKYKNRRASKGEKKIAQFFDSHNINYVREKTFVKCVNAKSNSLRFDFYLEQFNLLLEYQGHHHIKPINKYKRAKIVHEKTVVHDNIKEKFATENEINLFKILYTEYDNIETILETVLKELESGGESLENG